MAKLASALFFLAKKISPLVLMQEYKRRKVMNIVQGKVEHWVDR